MDENSLFATLEDVVDVVSIEYGLAVHDDLVTLDGDDFTRIFIHEVLDP